ncbi:outer membrane lipoprotein carrier protein LolA [Sediminibacillus dalangtanensis]|uniref:Outer membrane lipoprotein carrier protein LolA n=1 Tax=Sediminibacillus dalangtanensis TaxID=2729421 RepID=A0ABX7VQ81_9BACI|nr:outer membrane lipoprotein carrier protein LolA [Sediminibacillus dalangtanensis]QTM98124.1 outer membrane lipoprotein carrier protein LolA [Sediminibacillus dalangtanensis]
MRKKLGLGVMLLLLILVLAACGEKSKEDVADKLSGNLEKMNGYKAEATMSLQTGEESQAFDIEISHKKKDFYRVLLKNEKDEKGSQIILKNEDGVFVLTPALNKSFKFKSEWPNNSSQPYLYQSLVKDVLEDSEASFKTTENYYVFETKTNYQNNNNLPYQEIYFDKKAYTPVMVKVLDKDKNPVVEVQFSSFELDPEFAGDAFEIEKNMTSGTLGIPVSAEENDNGELEVFYPLERAGAELVEKKEVETENGERVILSFAGEKNFTLVQERADAYPASAMVPEQVNGEIVNLGFTMGALSEASLQWQANGNTYYLASEDLTKQEMIEVASSVTGQEIK